MNTKTFIGMVTITGLMAIGTQAQLTVNTMPATGLSEPVNIAEDGNYDVFISDSANNRIVRIDGTTQVQTTFVGSAGKGMVDGPAYLAEFNDPQGLLAVTINGTNGLLVTDSGNSAIRFVNFADGSVITIAGGTNGPANNATGTNAMFNQPLGMDQDTNGNVYIADSGNNVIRVINLNDPAFGVTNVTLSGPPLYQPNAVAFMGANNLWWRTPVIIPSSFIPCPHRQPEP